MKSIRILTILSAFIISHLAFGIGRVAAQSCTTQYGGATTCTPTDLTINKEVKNPITSLFVENLSTTDATFSPDSEILYRLTIKNGSGETFNPATVRDVFPDFVTFVAGPGSYDKASRTLTFTLENLIAGETRRIELLAKVYAKTAFPAGKSFFCVVNSASVTAPARPNGDSDTAQACIQTEVLGAKTLPVAGFNDLMILLPFAGMGLGGLALLKKKSLPRA